MTSTDGENMLRIMRRGVSLFFMVATGSAHAGEISFNREVRPILSNNCYYCHGTDPNHRKGNRRLDTPEGAMAEIEGVRAIVPGKPNDSELIARILSDDPETVMPPPKSNKSITPAEKETLRRWIAEGAKYEPHWAFVAPLRPPVPAGVNAIDHFVGTTLNANGLSFSPREKDGALLRRAALDLTGLPPTLSEIEQASPGNYEHRHRSPARLAALRRAHGARLAGRRPLRRHQRLSGRRLPHELAVARLGRQGVQRQHALRSVHHRAARRRPVGKADAGPARRHRLQPQPHDQRARAGRIHEENRTKYVFDRVETTSGVWLGLTMQCCQCHDHKFDPLKQSEYYSMYAFFNQMSETGKADKKFGRKDYSDENDKLYTMESPYISLSDETRDTALKAASQVTEQAKAAFVARKPDFHPQFVKWVEEMRANLALIEDRIQGSNVEFARSAVISAKLDDVLDGSTQLLLEVFLKKPEYATIYALKQEISKAKAAEDRVQATIPLVMVMNDSKPRETRILLRGNYETPGDKVEAGIPSFLPALPAGVKVDRLALAKWLVAPEQPLMSRVVVNRLWQLFFGRGLVKTADDFGLQGALPSHPELLDWLAVEFRESGWDVKHMVRLILTSRTYQQSAQLTPELLAKDPENVLLARGPRFRLDSRFLRDQALALSGLLVERRGGFPVMPYQPPGIWEDISFDKNRYFQGSGEDLHRRSLYTFWRRSVAPTNFFDAPARQVCALTPSRTNTPLHALTTLNDPTYVEAARVWAQRLAPLPDDTAKLRQLIRSATAREPEAREITSLRKTLIEAREHFASSPVEAEKLVGTGEAPLDHALNPVEHGAWTTVCLLVLNLDETLTK